MNLAKRLPKISALMNEKLDEWLNKHKPNQDKDHDKNKVTLSKELESRLKALGYAR